MSTARTETAAWFWDRVDEPDANGCELWLGSTTAEGYGTLGSKVYGTTSAHRVAYILSGREIPQGLTIDHLCRVRRCVNPDHMEPVTRGENTARAWAVNNRRRPGQKPGEHTPVRTFRVPDALWCAAKVMAALNGETVSDVLNRALAEYTKGEK